MHLKLIIYQLFRTTSLPNFSGFILNEVLQEVTGDVMPNLPSNLSDLSGLQDPILETSGTRVIPSVISDLAIQHPHITATKPHQLIMPIQQQPAANVRHHLVTTQTSRPFQQIIACSTSNGTVQSSRRSLGSSAPQQSVSAAHSRQQTLLLPANSRPALVSAAISSSSSHHPSGRHSVVTVVSRPQSYAPASRTSHQRPASVSGYLTQPCRSPAATEAQGSPTTSLSLEPGEFINIDGKLLSFDGKVLNLDGKILNLDGKIISVDSKMLPLDTGTQSSETINPADPAGVGLRPPPNYAEATKQLKVAMVRDISKVQV